MNKRHWMWTAGLVLAFLTTAFAPAKGEVLMIMPANAQVHTGGHVKFQVQLFNRFMVPQQMQQQVEWKVEPEWLGEISDDGFFVAGDRPGKGLVMAKMKWMDRWMKAVARIEVTGGPTADLADRLELIVHPRQVALQPGQQFQFRAALRFRNNQQPVPNLLVNWLVKPEKLGQIRQNGQFVAGDKVMEGKVVAYVEYMGKRIMGESRVVVGMKDSSAIAGAVEDEDQGGPIADALITAQRIGDIHWVRTARSDSDGVYLLANLIPGYYVVRAQKPGFIAEFYQDVRTFQQAKPVQVAEEDTVSGIDFHLNHGGKITGTVTAAVDNSPISGAHVFAVLVVNPRIKFHAFSGEDGSYSLEGLPTGTYLVGAGKGGYRVSYYQSAASLSEATPVDVQEGQTTPDIDIQLGIKSAIAGKVVSDVDGSPIAGAVVRARPLNHPSWMNAKKARTDGDGNYILQLPPGYYIVRAEADSFNGEYYDDTYEAATATPVQVQENTHTEGIDFSLAPLSTIEGTVTDQDDGTPIAGATVWAFSEVPGRMPVRAITDDQGHFQLTKLHPGIYFVKAAAPGYYREFYKEAERLADATPVNVGYNEQVQGIDFTLAKAASISGTVVDEETGAPIARAVVIAKRANSPVQKKAFTDDNGNYTVQGLPAGTYYVMAAAPGYYREFYDNSPDRSGATAVELSASEQKTDIDFSLQTAPENQGGISGVVLAESDSLPIPGAFVVALPVKNGHPAFAVTGPEGRYKIAGLASGKYFVIAWAEDYIGEFYNDARNWRKATPVAVVSPNTTPDIDFALRAKHMGPYTIRGKIIARGTQQPVANALVYAVSHHGILGFGISGDDGQYEIPNVPAGHYKIFATAPGMMQNNDGDPATQDSLSVDLSSGQDDYQANITMDTDFATGVQETPAAPETFQLNQNYPNPFNPETEIHFEIPQEGLVTLTVYNALGQRIATLMNGRKAAGRYTLTWNGRTDRGVVVPSGVYFYQLKVKNGDKVVFNQIRKMMLLK